MLVLSDRVHTVPWPEAGVELQLVPLLEDVDQQLAEATTERRFEGGRLVDVRRDVSRYAQGVGRHCVKGWSGVLDEAGEEVPCTPENVARAMLIRAFQDFVMLQVKSLSLHLAEEKAAAKNA